MAKRRYKKSRGGSMSQGRKVVKKVASYARAGIAAGPVLVPAVIASKDLMAGNASGAVSTFTYETIGYSLDRKTFDGGKFAEIVARDGAMLLGSMFIGYMNKRI